ncbi:PTS galactitol transporter subunit IIC [Clostridium luticellarii]|jgi:PTS system galactitol-specific IIC component|uniref:Galactitol permease IIC component n=1 Tax=Clostridium luticellarii TaxID=1691940 RepID=A0A2T0BC06_9CLOT|nr:PTS transporter subunit IIC [Clostridium luticellarii]MCI1946224.1 PTS galactitol transporter subunit IIC [Clostridium luticellarii]MCI1969523.1 PTS galactitol transporter subunit IIC [Clostridium luticellarii]MCI1996717.1 PTS galactitol transporter subunit IIC [Clostridium luticellarii]MCI2041007.1 PTS galactitol transporter subunit IIC [Clostridium luticellarii]PRR81431.1 Galactitol permease IIC component [Clostridium luticellarii]
MGAVIKYILDLGAAVFLPVVMIVIALGVKMKLKKAIVCGLTLGIAFTGMNVVLGFMFKSISPAANAFVNITGIKLTTIDVGWSPVAAIAWAWPYALVVFPIQIGINIVMLAFGWTNCLNVDMWNVWGKILTATIVAAITHSIPLALAAAAIEVVLELKNADLVQKSVCRLSKISNVTCPHVMNLQGVILAPISRLLDFIPGINKINLDSNKLKEKIGIFGENSVMGFIVGVLIAAIGRCSVKVILQTGVEIATALVLFPLVANLFLESLGPIAEAAGEYMKKKYKGREFCIGIDWSVLGGSSELWVTSILLVPVELVFAIILAKFGINSVLPLAAIINVAATVPALIVTGGNIIKMFIMGVITTPIYLLVSSEFAPILTNLARVQKTLTIPQGQFLTYYGIEGPEFRWTIAHAANIINGDIIGLALFICFIGLFFWYAKYMKRRDREMEVMEKKDIKIENVK